MPVYTYKATTPQRAPSTGAIVADTPRQARDLLRERGLVVQHLEPEKTGNVKKARLRGRRGVRRQVSTFLRELSTLLGVGVPLTEALETLAKQYKGAFQVIILSLRDRVAAGASLAQAMGEAGGAFDDLAIHITEVGEDSGTLDTSLARLADFRERSEQLKDKVATALIYPAIVLCIAMIASVFLMTFVVPRILQPLIEQGQQLPLPTLIVKSTSDFIVGWWWAIAAVAAGVVVLIAGILRTQRGLLAWQRFVLRIPLLGELVRKQAIVHVCVVMGTLLRSGIVFARAIQITQRTTGNLPIRAALVECEKAVLAGGDIGQAIDRSGVFPALVVQLFSVGQQTGRLEDMLERISQTYDQQVTTTSQRLAAVLEPIMIVILAAIVLLVVLATVLPILEAGNAIG